MVRNQDHFLISVDAFALKLQQNDIMEKYDITPSSAERKTAKGVSE